MDSRLDLARSHALRADIADAVSIAVRGSGPAGEGSPLLVVDAARVASEHADSLLQESIAAARHAGLSWAAVGEHLQVSRQAAQQRYGTPEPADPGPRRRLLKPVTAFDEMAKLAEAGRYGWHSVGFGMLFHTLESSDVQWEHHRELFPAPGTGRRLESEGWGQVGSGFPWGYYTRALDVPALPEPV